MRKRVKRIPKYHNGTPSVGTVTDPKTPKPYVDGFSFSNSIGEHWKNMDSAGQINAIAGGINAAGNMINNATSGEDVTAGGVVTGIGSGALTGAMIGGPWGALIGGAIGGVTSAVGSNYADENGVHNSGLASLVGNSPEWLAFKHNRMRNSVISQLQTENLKADYMNQYGGAVKVAEGGIMRRPVEMLVSPGEIRINPYTLEYKRYGGSNEEPNTKDNKYDIGFEKDIILSHAPHMKLPNGKTVADNGEMILNANMSKEAIIKNIKKLVNWQEQHRTKPQEYAMYGGGTGKDGVESKPIKKRRNSIWNRIQDKWNASAINDWFENYYNNIDKYEDHAIVDGRLFIKHDGKWYDSHKGGLGRAIKGNVLPESGKGYMTDRHQTVPFRQGVFADVDKSKIVKHKKNNTAVSDIIKPNSNNGNTTSPELDFVSFRHTNSDYNVPGSDIATNDVNSEITESKKGTASKPTSGKKIAAVSQEGKRTPEQIAESLRIEDIGERHWLRGSVTEPKQSFASLAKVTPEKIKLQGVNNVAPLTGIKPSTGTTGTDDTGYTGSNWQDGLYRMAVLSQPLWDRAKAEPIDWTSPVYKYMPTQIDVNSQFRDADQSYALARYNFANLYPNTGAGMAAGLQAASDRAKQYADIRQYQTNAQNELIGKNVGIYNNLANEHARILNNVYNKSAQNRAAARNINRQNRATALNNYGTMLSDDKKMNTEAQNNRLKVSMLKPFIESVYENSDELIPMLAPYTMNRNVKKKSSTR